MEVKDKVVTVEGLKGAYDNLNGKISANDTDITNLQNSVTQLNSDIGINREELAPGFISIRQGKKRILNINGYITSTKSADNFCALGNIDYPLYNVTFPVSVEGIGLGFVIITTSGRGTLYNDTLSDYLSGTVRGTVEYLANI